MFIQIFRSKDIFVMVNIKHIVSIEPIKNGGGCTIILSTGLTFHSVEDYNVVLENIENVK